MYDAKLQIRGSELLPDLVEIEGQLYYTYSVTNKSPEQIEAEEQAYLNGLDAVWDEQAAKRLLQKVAEPILADEVNLTEQSVADTMMLYKHWRVGNIYNKDSSDIDQKRFVYNNELYNVIATEHKAQSDWTPDIAISLYVKITPPGIIAEWKQPLGPQDAYHIGDKVTHNGFKWECTQADGNGNNVWEPGVYGWTNLGAV